MRKHDMLLQEEARPVASALFANPSLTFHLGFDQADLANPDWYKQLNHPYLKAIGQILDEIHTLPYLKRLEILIANGADPLTSLQIQLDRKSFSLDQLPSLILDRHLETQQIYSFSK